MQDPYTVLGVDRRADADTIRKAYRKLAKEWHPDVNPDPRAESRLKEINGAYEVLGDDDKRRLWDEFGEQSARPGFDANAARGFRGRGGSAGFDGGAVDVDDLLGSLFGAGGGFERGPRRGADQQLDLAVDFLTSVLGGERVVSLRRSDGTSETVRIPIPAGAKDGGRVRLKGHGLPPRGGGPCGDLLVNLKVQDHPLLRREDDDLVLEVPITLLEAIRGGPITVPTPTGDVKVTVPSGVQSGTRMRLKGRGVQKKDGPGDLYLLLRPQVPQSQDPEILAAAERIEQAYAGDVRKGLKI
jgi:curved DNA-binding protein